MDRGRLPVNESRQARALAFGIETKRAFIEHARRLWPNVSAICELVGIRRTTFELHYDIDPGFKDEINQIRQAQLDKIESVMVDVANTPKGFMDRIAQLRAHRPQVWAPDRSVVVRHELGKQEIEAKAGNLARLQAIDADVIQEIPPHWRRDDPAKLPQPTHTEPVSNEHTQHTAPAPDESRARTLSLADTDGMDLPPDDRFMGADEPPV